MVSTWLAADLDTPAGRQLARAAATHVKSSNQMRVAFIHNSQEGNPGNKYNSSRQREKGDNWLFITLIPKVL